LAPITVVPNIRKESCSKAKSIGISLPPQLAREAKIYAFCIGMSFSKFVSQLLLRELKSARGLRLKHPEPAQASSGLDKLSN
jgi:hypothetical protein